MESKTGQTARSTSQTVSSDVASVTSQYAHKKGYRVKASPGYQPGSSSPLKERPVPPPPINPADGPAIVREMIEDSLEDLEDYEEWVLHCSCLTMWSFIASMLGIFMILMSRSMTPLFYSMKPNDILFGFGLAFQLPLIRWMVILCFPNKEEKRRRKAIRVKKKERQQADLRGHRFVMMEDMYTNKIVPQMTQHTIYYNNQADNVSVLTAPTMLPTGGAHIENFQKFKASMNLNNHGETKSDFANIGEQQRPKTQPGTFRNV